DAFEDSVNAEDAGELAHALNRLVASLAHDVRCAELPRQRDSVGMAAQDDDLLGAEAAGGNHTAQTDGAVSDNSRCLPRANFGADGLDDADGLVAHAAAGLAVFQRLVRPEIAAADGSAGDDDEGVGRPDQAGVGDGLDMDIAGAEHHSCMHRVSYLRFPAGCGSLRARYCSSLTFSIQSAVFPSSCS